MSEHGRIIKVFKIYHLSCYTNHPFSFSCISLINVHFLHLVSLIFYSFIPHLLQSYHVPDTIPSYTIENTLKEVLAFQKLKA